MLAPHLGAVFHRESSMHDNGKTTTTTVKTHVFKLLSLELSFTKGTTKNGVVTTPFLKCVETVPVRS